MSSKNIDKFDEWKNFKQALGEEGQKPLDIKKLSQFLKITFKPFFNFEEMENYFFQEFSL